MIKRGRRRERPEIASIPFFSSLNPEAAGEREFVTFTDFYCAFFLLV